MESLPGKVSLLSLNSSSYMYSGNKLGLCVDVNHIYHL